MITNLDKKIAMKIGLSMVNTLVQRTSTLIGVENTIVNEVMSKLSPRVLISGYNRRNTGGKNIIKKNDFAKNNLLVIVNILDGQTNYNRNSKMFGNSLTLFDSSDATQYSVVYEGLTQEIHEVSSDSDVLLNKPSKDKARLILGIGHIKDFSSSSLQTTKNYSIRSIGSTTLSIMEVIQNRFDIYVTKTKMWNFWWSLAYAQKSNLIIEDLLAQRNILDNNSEYLKHPENSILMACYKNPTIRKAVHAILSDFVANNLERNQK